MTTPPRQPAFSPKSPPQLTPRRAMDFANSQLDTRYARLTRPVLRLVVGQFGDPFLNALWDKVEQDIQARADKDDAETQAALRESLKRLTSAISDKMPAVERATGRATAAIRADAITLADDAILRESFGVTSPEQLQRIGVNWNRVNPDTIEAASDFINNPAYEQKLKGINQTIRDQIFTGIFEGQGPLATARRLRQELPDIAAYHLNRLMRTTQLTSFRESTAENQRRNARLFAYQLRIEARDDRCCIACWALHGKKYPVGELIIEHEQGRGRGVAIPVGSTVTIPTGPELWRDLPAERQRLIAGDAAYNAIKAGAADLADFVGEYDDPVFGRMITERSLKNVIGERARRYYARMQHDEQNG